MFLTVIPAYGRDYKSKAAALEDWNQNRDFILATIAHPASGRYINKQDADQDGDSIMIRYASLRRIVNVPKDATK